MNNNNSIPAALFTLVLVITIGLSWCFNLYKLTQCDFVAPYKGEAIHAVGLIPVAAPFTVWCDAK